MTAARAAKSQKATIPPTPTHGSGTPASRTCARCPNPPRTPRATYCEEHRQEARKAQWLQTPDPIDCERCGTTFRPYRSKQKWCDDCAPYGRAEQNSGRIRMNAPTRQRISHPTGYEPGYELNGDTGTVTSEPIETPPDRITSWDWLLERWHLDPAEFEVIEPVNIRTWLAAIGDGETREFYYYRANVRRRQAGTLLSSHREIIDRIRDLPAIRVAKPKGKYTFVAVYSDAQIGKSDGDGTDGTITRYRDATERVATELERMRAFGYDIDAIERLHPGDNFEGVQGHYAMQGFSVDRSMTEQQIEYVDLETEAINLTAPLARRVWNRYVRGNHGEVRTNGSKANTAFSDNYDSAAGEILRRICAQNPKRFGHVGFQTPSGENLTLTFQCQNDIICLLHGHQGRVSAPSAHAKIVKWADGQAGGFRAAGDATIYVSGHYHHYSVMRPGGRTFIQAPALDGGSVWFAETNGDESPPGVVTFLVGPGGPLHITMHEVYPQPPRFAQAVRAARSA